MVGKKYSAVEMLAKLVSFDTTSRDSNLALIDFVEEYLGSHGVTGFRVYDESGKKANFFARLGPDAPGGVVLSGHTDVVPVDDQDWATDPFSLVEIDGLLYGRGTCDMKGFSAAALSLAPEILSSALTAPIYLALSYDEEVGCVGVHGLLDQLSKLNIEPRAVLVGEPTNMQVVQAHKGIQSYQTTITGLEAHSSNTHKGVSAISIAVKIIAKLEELAERLKDLHRDDHFQPPYSTLSVGMIEGGTAVNIIPGRCRFRWECRPLPGFDIDPLIEEWRQWVETFVVAPLAREFPGVQVQTKQMSRTPGLRAEPGSSAETLALLLTQSNQTRAVSFATEAGLFQNQLSYPTVVCGPGSIDQAHKPNEFLSVAQLDLCVETLRRLIKELSS